jgi:hypothetical protein
MVGEPFQPGRQKPYIVLPKEPTPFADCLAELDRCARQVAQAARMPRLNPGQMALNLWAANKGNGGLVLDTRIGSPFAPLAPIELPVSLRRSCRLSPDAVLRHEPSGLIGYDTHLSFQSAAEIRAAPPPAATTADPAPTEAAPAADVPPAPQGAAETPAGTPQAAAQVFAAGALPTPQAPAPATPRRRTSKEENDAKDDEILGGLIRAGNVEEPTDLTKGYYTEATPITEHFKRLRGSGKSTKNQRARAAKALQRRARKHQPTPV